MPTEIHVPEAKYREIDKKNSCSSIGEKGSCQTFFWQNAEYVSTGAMGSGGGDWACIWGYRLEELATYKGDLKPLKYNDHNQDVNAGGRERSYEGMLVTSGKRQLVIVGKQITFKKLEVGKQLAIF
ncbi:hypothetical protein A6C57_00960 [Fibrella sp. ES10-3-2-2]|nr:hypothetical protein A6C57_00960 [Fibrella sp. ES10-3-2-2]